MNPRAVLLGLLAGGALTALVHGAVDGPRWLLLLGLNATVLVLVVVDLISRVSRAGIAPGLRAGGARAFAPAVVHGVRAVHTASGRASGRPASPDTTFEFDLTVAPGDRDPFRVKVLHPLDAQDAGNRRSMVVEYDPGQPWRVIVALRPPAEWARRAGELERTGLSGARLEPPRPELRVLGLGAVTAALLLTLIQLAG